jgi:hypothetical protein
MADSRSYNGGIGFVSLLTVLFIGLKLTGNIAWSWWWVLSPIWITWGFTIGILLLIGLCALLAVWLDSKSVTPPRSKKFRR